LKAKPEMEFLNSMRAALDLELLRVTECAARLDFGARS